MHLSHAKILIFPQKILEETADIFTEVLHRSFHEFVKKSEFSSALKQENTTPVFKKVERECKNNYIPVSILSNVSKYLRELFSGKYQIIWIPSFPSINVDLGEK